MTTGLPPAAETPAGQKASFLAGEGDAWFLRNRPSRHHAELAANDPVLTILATMGIAPRTVLEVGSADGWRLEELRRRHGCRGVGVDPSGEAVAAARRDYPLLDIRHATADDLPFADGCADLVIAGFCLYLCDRADLFRIAWQMDRVLADGGWLVVYDFYSRIPYRNPYAHKPDLFSHKMDHTALFTWHPAYTTVHHHLFSHQDHRASALPDPARPDDWLAVTALRKDLVRAFPPNPFAARE